MAGGLLENLGRWDTAGDWSSGAVAGDADIATIPASQANDIIGPTAANRNVTLAKFHTHPGYTKSCGSSALPIILASELVHVQGGGDFYFQTHKNAGANNVTDEVRIEAGPTAKIEIGSNPADANSDITMVNVLLGDATLTGTIKFPPTGMVAVGQGGGSGATCRIVSSAEALPDYIQTAGRGFIDNVVNRMTIVGGTVVKSVNEAIIIDIFAGGELVYQHGAVSGEVLICRVHSGARLDLMQNGLLKEFDLTIRYRGATIISSDTLHTLNIVDIDREG